MHVLHPFWYRRDSIYGRRRLTAISVVHSANTSGSLPDHCAQVAGTERWIRQLTVHLPLAQLQDYAIRGCIAMMAMLRWESSGDGSLSEDEISALREWLV